MLRARNAQNADSKIAFDVNIYLASSDGIRSPQTTALRGENSFGGTHRARCLESKLHAEGRRAKGETFAEMRTLERDLLDRIRM